MDLNEIRTINSIGLHNLARLIGMTDEETEYHIKRMRDEFEKHGDVKISEAIPEMTRNRSLNDVMSGAILAIFMSDFYFSEYINGDL